MYQIFESSKFEIKFKKCFFLTNINDDIEFILFYIKQKYYQMYLDNKVLFFIEINDFFEVYKDLDDFCDDFNLSLYLDITPPNTKKVFINYNLEDNQVDFIDELYTFRFNIQNDVFKNMHLLQ